MEYPSCPGEGSETQHLVSGMREDFDVSSMVFNPEGNELGMKVVGLHTPE